MADAKLKFDDKEYTLSAGVTTIGRTSENFVAFSEDSNVSRFHAEIEKRDGDFWLIELGSSNGTTLNGEPLKSEKLLSDGDIIVLGGSSQIEFSVESKSENLAVGGMSGGDSTGEDSTDSETGEFQKEEESVIAEDSETASKSSTILNVAGVAVGLAVICVFAAGIYYYTKSPPPCEARAAIIKPETGDVIKTETEVEVEAENTECASRAVFVLDDMVISSSDLKSYDASIDPREFPELADGLNHPLRVIFEDEEGNQVGQPAEVLLAFETLATPTPTPVEIPTGDEIPKPPPPREKELSLIDTQEMAKRLVKQFPGNFEYRFNKQFLQEVQKRTGEYKTGGYFTRAQLYRDVINEAYVKEQNLEAPLGFMLAMSRSKFIPERQGTNEGLWQMSNDLVTANAYNGTCENKDLNEASQKCAAIASAAYLKALVLNIFEGNVIYSAAAFGMSPLEASEWKSTLPQNSVDFWQNIKNPQQREQVVRFFAAGIVAENPQKFGLKNDLPISELYKNLMVN